MIINYNKLWKQLINKGMNETQFQTQAKISPSTMAKFWRGSNVQTDVPVRSRETLGRGIAVVVEVIEGKGA